jgi:hypothetical protein
MSPMTKTTLAAALLAALAAEASAQSRTFYDSAGRVVGKSSTDSQGTGRLRSDVAPSAFVEPKGLGLRPTGCIGHHFFDSPKSLT